MSRDLSVIISTYNSEAWLEKVLWGYAAQTFKNFELLIADDGSRPATRVLIEKMQQVVDYPIVHVWHEDDGFQKSKILNKAIQQTNTDYILMSDGDCIPRVDFLAVHHKYRQPGYFLSGGYFKLPMTLSKAITANDIEKQYCFSLVWLRQHGLPKTVKTLKLTASGGLSTLLNRLTPTKATWNGHNASGWKSDMLAVNGFDERMQYGGQDREFGERLMHYGIKGMQLRYSAICIHLDHPRGYARPESIRKNLAIRRETRLLKKRYTPYGIVKG